MTLVRTISAAAVFWVWSRARVPRPYIDPAQIIIHGPSRQRAGP